MGEHANAIVRGGWMGVKLAEQLLKDVKPETFARKPSIGGKVIEMNHPAFNFGHLAIYPMRWLEAVGLKSAATEMPATYADLFAAGKPCHDDPDGTIYPPMKDITDRFFAGHKAALDLLSGLDDAVLLKPNPREGRLKEMFPTMGGVMGFYLNNHVMVHLGQVSGWRRCFGLGSAM